MSGQDAPLIVDTEADLPRKAAGWIFVRETGKFYVARDEEWVLYEAPPPTSVWSLLEEES